jgi:hypothetical protein
VRSALAFLDAPLRILLAQIKFVVYKTPLLAGLEKARRRA